MNAFYRQRILSAEPFNGLNDHRRERIVGN